MTDEPHHRLHRRSPIQVEPLEGRALQSAVTATTPPGQARVVMRPSSQYVNQQQASFTVTLYLTNKDNPQAAAALDEPVIVDFSASIIPPVSVTPEATSPFVALFHESVTFPAGASAETVTVPIISNAIATFPAEIYLSAGSTLGSKVDRDITQSVYLYSDSDASRPIITGVQLVTQRKLASAVVLDFSKPMAQATVEDSQNYRILSRPTQTSRAGFLFWAGSTTTEIHSFPIAAAHYDPSTSTVTLTLKHPARASSLFEVSSAYPLNGHELTDTEGQTLGSPSLYSFEEGFTNLIHPIAGVTPPPVGPLKTTLSTGSPISNLNPLKGFS